MPQGTISLDSVVAVPGQLYGSDKHLTDTFVATEDLFPGRVVELDPTDDRKVRYPQTASAVGKLAEIVVWDSVRTTGGYKAGDHVPVCYFGDIYAEFNGTTDAAGTQAKVNSSSTTATNRGKLTDAATSAGAGTEIYQTKINFVRDITSDSTLCLARMNGPLT